MQAWSWQATMETLPAPMESYQPRFGFLQICEVHQQALYEGLHQSFFTASIGDQDNHYSNTFYNPLE